MKASGAAQPAGMRRRETRAPPQRRRGPGWRTRIVAQLLGSGMTGIRPDTEISGRRFSRTPIISDSDRAPPLLARPSRATRCVPRRDSDSGRLAACAHGGSRYSRFTRRPLLPHAPLAHARQARRTSSSRRGAAAVRRRRSASPPLPTAALAGGGRRVVQGGGLCSTSLTRRLTRTGFQVLRRPRGGSREFG